MKTLSPLLCLILTLSTTHAFAAPSDANGILNSTGGVGLVGPNGSNNNTGVLITGDSALQLYGLLMGKLAGSMELANNLTCWKPDAASAQCTLEIDSTGAISSWFSIVIFEAPRASNEADVDPIFNSSNAKISIVGDAARQLYYFLNVAEVNHVKQGASIVCRQRTLLGSAPDAQSFNYECDFQSDADGTITVFN